MRTAEAQPIPLSPLDLATSEALAIEPNPDHHMNLDEDSPLSLQAEIFFHSGGSGKSRVVHRPPGRKPPDKNVIESLKGYWDGVFGKKSTHIGPDGEMRNTKLYNEHLKPIKAKEWKEREKEKCGVTAEKKRNIKDQEHAEELERQRIAHENKTATPLSLFESTDAHPPTVIVPIEQKSNRKKKAPTLIFGQKPPDLEKPKKKSSKPSKNPRQWSNQDWYYAAKRKHGGPGLIVELPTLPPEGSSSRGWAIQQMMKGDTVTIRHGLDGPYEKGGIIYQHPISQPPKTNMEKEKKPKRRK